MLQFKLSETFRRQKNVCRSDKGCLTMARAAWIWLLSIFKGGGITVCQVIFTTDNFAKLEGNFKH